MKNYLFIVGIIVLVTVFGLFSFWPNIMEAHYGGSLSCPLLSMGDVAGCQNMTNHLNDLFEHISEFLVMISAVLVGGILFFILLIVIRLFSIKKIIENLFLENKKNYHTLRFLNESGVIAEFLYIISFGLRKGILNTKIF